MPRDDAPAIMKTDTQWAEELLMLQADALWRRGLSLEPSDEAERETIAWEMADTLTVRYGMLAGGIPLGGIAEARRIGAGLAAYAATLAFWPPEPDGDDEGDGGEEW